MKYTKHECPKCHGKLILVDGVDTYKCKYCGKEYVLEEQSRESIRAKVRFKELDVGAKVRMKELDHEREMFDAFNKRERRKENEGVKQFIILFGVLFLVLAIWALVMYIPHVRQVHKMERLVDEIQVDIEAGNYDEARIKANQITYDVNWSDETKDHWKAVKKDLLKMIKEKQEAEYIPMPKSAKAYRGDKYKKVLKELKNAGFTNLEIRPSEKKASFFHKKDTIQSISINGDTKFKAGEKYPPDSKVLLFYYKK